MTPFPPNTNEPNSYYVSNESFPSFVFHQIPLFESLIVFLIRMKVDYSALCSFGTRLLGRAPEASGSDEPENTASVKTGIRSPQLRPPASTLNKLKTLLSV